MEKYVLDSFKNFISTKKINKNNLRILIVGLSYKYGVAATRNSINLKIYDKIKKISKKTSYFDPFIVDSKLKSSANMKNIDSYDVIIFLSKGKIYENFFNKIYLRKPEVLLDPFYYYTK